MQIGMGVWYFSISLWLSFWVHGHEFSLHLVLELRHSSAFRPIWIEELFIGSFWNTQGKHHFKNSKFETHIDVT